MLKNDKRGCIVNKKRIYVLLTLIVILIQLMPCNYKSIFKTKCSIPNDTIISIKANRNLIQNDYKEKEKMQKFKNILYKYENFYDEIPPEKIFKSSNQAVKDEEIVFSSLKNSCTVKESIEDIEYMFNVLKYSYAGYEYFGGDKVFLSAKQKIISSLNDFEENITISTLFQLICSHMDFIQDGHFLIFSYGNYYKPCKKYFYLNNDIFEINKDKKGFFINIDESKYYIVSIDNDKNIEKYIKPSFSQDGNIIYNFGLIDCEKYKNIDVFLKFGKNKIIKNISLTYKTPQQLGNLGYKIDKVDGVIIVKNRRMQHISLEDKQLDQFVESAKKLKNEKVFILDIRSNTGGYSTFPMNWFKNFTGLYQSDERFSAFLNTTTTNKIKLNANLKNDGVAKKISFKIDEIKKGIIKEGWEYVGYRQETRIDNNSLVIVLMDENVASSGEEMIRYLRTLNNVIFIGTNTAGLDLVGGNNSWYLPNSNIGINSGTNISLSSSLQNIDGKGFYPDFWINSSDIVERVIKFLKKYDTSSINISK